MKKIIYLGADHNGWQMKNDLRDWLVSGGYEVKDLGPEQKDQSDDYPDYGFKVGHAVAKNSPSGFGILICGSGVGMAVAAGKVPGVRAALIHDVGIARAARQDDNINVLALGAKFIDLDQAKTVVRAWLGTDFTGEERHVRRVGKISDYEQGGRANKHGK